MTHDLKALAERLDEMSLGGKARFNRGLLSEACASILWAAQEIKRKDRALATIVEWGPFPETGLFHPDGTPQSYGWCYGSNGQRDYMRDIARAALAKDSHE